ncbi:MAG: HD domain-containing protein, partial [Planctomycetales bacterium]
VRRIDHPTWEAIRATMQLQPIEVELDDEVRGRFLSLISQPARLGELLRRLHELRVLEKIIPGLKHARCLLQFNQYHKYTVDEHSIRAVEAATDFSQDEGLLGKVYAKVKKKWLLHLALLLHDLCKGIEEDHSDVGARLAQETADRLGLSEPDAEILVFLVHKHLHMAHLAFRRDISSEELLVRFAVEAQSAQVLRMLFLLTVADVTAVGPGVWNDWKSRLMFTLYDRTMRRLSPEKAPLDETVEIENHRASVRDCLQADWNDWYRTELDQLPTSFLFSAPSEQIAEQLKELHGLAPGEAVSRGQWSEDRGAMEYTVATREGVTPGVFHKLAGALSSKGLEILSAEINTLSDNLVLDRFWVHDGDYADQPPEQRVADVNESLAQAARSEAPPALHQGRRYGRYRSRPELVQLPTKVRIDNSTSDQYTIIDVFAADRPGLLYVIGRSLFELELSVSLAKIGTYLDQVVDVFYVTDSRHAKIEDRGRLKRIRETLRQSIEEFEREALEAESSA